MNQPISSFLWSWYRSGLQPNIASGCSHKRGPLAGTVKVAVFAVSGSGGDSWDPSPLKDPDGRGNSYGLIPIGYGYLMLPSIYTYAAFLNFQECVFKVLFRFCVGNVHRRLPFWYSWKIHAWRSSLNWPLFTRRAGRNPRKCVEICASFAVRVFHST